MFKKLAFILALGIGTSASAATPKTLNVHCQVYYYVVSEFKKIIYADVDVHLIDDADHDTQNIYKTDKLRYAISFAFNQLTGEIDSEQQRVGYATSVVGELQIGATADLPEMICTPK